MLASIVSVCLMFASATFRAELQAAGGILLILSKSAFIFLD